MTIEKWKEILSCEGVADILTDQHYNEDYSHEIHLTVKEIRQIASRLEPLVMQKPAEESLLMKIYAGRVHADTHQYEDNYVFFNGDTKKIKQLVNNLSQVIIWIDRRNIHNELIADCIHKAEQLKGIKYDSRFSV